MARILKDLIKYKNACNFYYKCFITFVEIKNIICFHKADDITENMYIFIILRFNLLSLAYVNNWKYYENSLFNPNSNYMFIYSNIV